MIQHSSLECPWHAHEQAFRGRLCRSRQLPWFTPWRRQVSFEVTDPCRLRHAGLCLGVVIGVTSYLPGDLAEGMRTTGLTHITAVSGTNSGQKRQGLPMQNRLP